MPSSPGFQPPSMPAVAPKPGGPTGPTGMTGALPLDATEGAVRIAKKSGTREALAPTVPLDEKNNTDFRKARRAKPSRAIWYVLAAVLLGGGGYLGYRYQPWVKEKPVAVVAPPPPIEVAPPVEKVEKPPEKPPKPAKTEDDEKMSSAEIDRMLEWARRTAEGGRIIAPPGDNLKELLDRIEKADPGNAGAAQLKSTTTKILSRKGMLALKKGRVDEAVQDLESLAALKPDDASTKRNLARALRMRAEHMLEKRKVAAAFTDVNASLELDPDDTNARIVLADILLAQGKPQEAADEYQRILDGKPADKRARRGLLAANAAKVKPVKKKHPK
jgi:cytochrome c-type biogenesis protein CcmH/NrfG